MTQLKKRRFSIALLLSVTAYIFIIAVGFLTRFFIPEMDWPGNLLYHFLIIIIYCAAFKLLPAKSPAYFFLLAAIFFLIMFNITPQFLPTKKPLSFNGRFDGHYYHLKPEASGYYYFAMLLQSEKQREDLSLLMPEIDSGPYFAKIELRNNRVSINRLMPLYFDRLKPIINPHDYNIMVEYLTKGVTYQVAATIGQIEEGKSPPAIFHPLYFDPRNPLVDKSMIIENREITETLIPVDSIHPSLVPSLDIYSQHWTLDALITFVIPNKFRDYNCLISATALGLLVCFLFISTLGKTIHFLRRNKHGNIRRSDNA